MKKVSKLASIVIATIGIFSLVASGCKETVRYDKYDDAQLYLKDGGKSYAATEVKQIEIDWIAGTVEIEQSASNQVQILEEDGLETEAHRMHYYLDSQGVLNVKYCASGLRDSINANKKNLRVSVPDNVSVELDVVTAKVTVSNVQLNSFSFEDVSGNFSAERISCLNTAEFETVSGELKIADLVAKSLSIETVSADVSISRLSATTLEADTVSGALNLGLTSGGNGNIESTSGDVAVTLYNDLGITVRFNTGSGRLDTSKKYEQKGSYYTFVGTNASSYQMEFESVSGDLKIE